MSVDLKRAVKLSDLARLMLKDGDKIPCENKAKASEWGTSLLSESITWFEQDIQRSVMNAMLTRERIPYNAINDIWPTGATGSRSDIARTALSVIGVEAVEIDEEVPFRVVVRIIRAAPEQNFQAGQNPSRTSLAIAVRNVLATHIPIGIDCIVKMDTPSTRFMMAIDHIARSNIIRGLPTTPDTLALIKNEFQSYLHDTYGYSSDVLSTVRVTYASGIERFLSPRLDIRVTIDRQEYAYRL